MINVLPGAYSALALSLINQIRSLSHRIGTPSKSLVFISSSRGLWSVINLNLSIPTRYNWKLSQAYTPAKHSFWSVHAWFQHQLVSLNNKLLASSFHQVTEEGHPLSCSCLHLLTQLSVLVGHSEPRRVRWWGLHWVAEMSAVADLSLFSTSYRGLAALVCIYPCSWSCPVLTLACEPLWGHVDCWWCSADLGLLSLNWSTLCGLWTAFLIFGHTLLLVDCCDMTPASSRECSPI